MSGTEQITTATVHVSGSAPRRQPERAAKHVGRATTHRQSPSTGPGSGSHLEEDEIVEEQQPQAELEVSQARVRALQEQLRAETQIRELEEQLRALRAAAANRRSPSSRREPPPSPRRDSQISFKEEMEEIDAFTGEDDTYPVDVWVRRVEQTADAFDWNMTKLKLAAKRALTGAAASWVRSQHDIQSWTELKNGLIEEFGRRADGARIVELMQRERPRDGESLQAFSLRMRQMGRQGNIEDSWVIRYVAQGLPGDAIQKTAIYHCRNFQELREQIATYEIVLQDRASRAGSRGQGNRPVRPQSSSKDGSERVCWTCRRTGHISRDCQDQEKLKGRTCHNCGVSGHLGRECPDQGKGRICFNCRAPGHIARECPNDRKRGPSGPTQAPPAKVRCIAEDEVEQA